MTAWSNGLNSGYLR